MAKPSRRSCGAGSQRSARGAFRRQAITRVTSWENEQYSGQHIAMDLTARIAGAPFEEVQSAAMVELLINNAASGFWNFANIDLDPSGT